MRHDGHGLAIPGPGSPPEHVPDLVQTDILEPGASEQLNVSRGPRRFSERRRRDLGQLNELPFASRL